MDTKNEIEKKKSTNLFKMEKESNSIKNNNNANIKSIGKKIKRTESSNSLIGDDSKEEENTKNLRTGRWHTKEHFRFIKGCLMYGNNWKKVKKQKKKKLHRIIIFYFILKTFRLHPNN